MIWIKGSKQQKFSLIFFLWAAIYATPAVAYPENIQSQEEGIPNDTENHQPSDGQPIRKINEIHVIGNKYIDRGAILSHVPYKKGEIFNPSKTNQLITNLYYSLKRLRNVIVKTENKGDTLIDLYVIVQERPILKEMLVKGNKQISETEIKKNINFNIPSIDEAELKIYAQKIKKLYIDKGYFQTAVDGELKMDEAGLATAIFTVQEDKKSLVKQINFIGNKTINSKTLRSVIYTKEDWILGFMDQSGTYHPDRIDADKHMIEQQYKNNGYLNAKVTNVEQTMDAETKNLVLLFEIDEGDQFTITEIQAPGNDILTEEQILAGLPIKPGMIYSQKKITDTIKALEFLWGSFGHIFAHIEPSIQPDNETRTVNLAFYTDLGDKVFLNKINIMGNKKSHDKVIRRKIMLQEGDILTNQYMEMSKNNVESLGYFDPREGVNWKIRRIAQDTADLDLVVKETKTGNFYLQGGYGGAGADIRSPVSGLNVKLGLADSNLLGLGVNFNFDATWANNEQSVVFHIAQPFLFDRPISAGLDIFHRRPTYDNLKHTTPATVNERVTGCAASFGYIPRHPYPFFYSTAINGGFGIDSLSYQQPPVASGLPAEQLVQYQSILQQEFVNGKYGWITLGLNQDTRNHPIHPSRGHVWRLTSRAALPGITNTISYYKLTYDFSWFTPLIGEQDLVFKLHTLFGFVTAAKNKTIPYGELFNLGGPASIRGYLFGQIAPQFAGDSIGGKKCFVLNSELSFPIKPDLTIKGVVFYDGGSSFDSPHSHIVGTNFVTNNNFDYRHSIGFGIRMLSPMPIRIDWGFKLDPRPNETAYEVHFGMTYDW